MLIKIYKVEEHWQNDRYRKIIIKQLIESEYQLIISSMRGFEDSIGGRYII